MEKERRTKTLLLSTLVVVVATLSIAFAAVSRTLNINGIGKMDTAKWDVRFENLREAEITRDAVELDKPKIIDNGGTVENINVKLTKPKDEISYKVDIANRGTIDAQVNIMTMSKLTEEEKKLIDFGVYYLNGAKITKYDLLEPGDVKSIIIKIRYKDDITEHDLPSEPLTINLSCQIEYVQSNAEVVIKPNGNYESDKNGGYIFDGVESVLAGFDVETNSTFNVEPTYFENSEEGVYGIESISFLDNMKVPKKAKDTVWDASLNKDGSVVGWYLNEDKDDKYEVYIGGNGNVIAPESCRWLFAPLTEGLKTINFNENFDTSNVTDMSAMFFCCYELEEINGMSFDTSNVTNMGNYSYSNEEGMFCYCTSLTNLDLSSFDTTNVTDMSGMFTGCESLKSLNLSSFDTSNVIHMSSMFEGCSSLTSINLSSFNTSKVTDMMAMFCNCSSLLKLDLSLFNTSSVTNMSSMFFYCTSLTSLELSSFDTINVTNMSDMFQDCTSLTSLDLSSFDTSNVTEMNSFFAVGMFKGCKSLKSLDLSSFDTSNVINMNNMFEDCTSLVSLNLSSFNTDNVIYMNDMFSGCVSLISLSLSSFNTSKVTDMENMFENCASLTSLELSSFNTLSVTDMDEMFSGCKSLTSLNLSSFNTSKVTDMSKMFIGCLSLKSLDLSTFDTSKVTDMSYMFRDCLSLTSLDMSNANFSKFGKYNDMFKSVSGDIIIYVKDYDAKTFITNKIKDAKVLIGAPIAFNMDSLQRKVNYSFFIVF